jgi:hypothetical protein
MVKNMTTLAPNMSNGWGVFRPRLDGESLPMRGQGHDPLAKPVDPTTLAAQIIASNQLEGIDPSGEIERHLPPPENY